MLISDQLIEIKWRKDNKEWYESKGYIYTQTSDSFFVKVEDLPHGSSQKVQVQCDYCGRIYETTYKDYNHSLKNINKCACGNKECRLQKSSDVKQTNSIITRKNYLNQFYTKCEEYGYNPITTLDDYPDTNSSVVFECPKHGVVSISSISYFLQSEFGCPKCGREKRGEKFRKNIDEVISIVESKNGDKIKNPEDYINSKTKNLIIICGKCGKEFLSSLMNIQEGSGQCFQCANKDTANHLKRSKDNLIKSVESKNNNKIKNPDDYINAYTNNLIITCGQCGNDFVTSFASLSNNNSLGLCPECGYKKISEQKRLRKEEIIAIVTSKNDDELLNPEDYINSNCKNLWIKCGSCGKIFLSSLSSIQRTKGQCYDCGNTSLSENKRMSRNELIKRAEELSDSVLLNPEEYTNNSTNNLKFRCSCGNIFTTSWASYYGKGKVRCGTCARSISSLERIVMDFLDFCHIKYIYNKIFEDCRDILYLPFDFYLPDYNIIIETDGKQHYEPVFGEENFKRTVLHDGMKNNYCKWNNINLLRIPYWNGGSIERVISNYLGINYGKYFQQIEYIPTKVRKQLKTKTEVT